MKRIMLMLMAMMLTVGSAAFADKEDFINPEGAIAALKSGAEETREHAAKYLGDIRYAKATKALLEAINDASDDVREEAVKALGKIQAKEAVDALIGKLSESSSGVRVTAAEALARIGDPKAVEPIRKQAAAEFNPINKTRMNMAADRLQAAQPAAK